MKKFLLLLWILFTVLTLIGAAYVIINRGEVTAGFACVPMIFSLTCGSLYRAVKAKQTKENRDTNNES